MGDSTPASASTPPPTPPGFSTEHVRKLARLSRLALSDAEVADAQAKISEVVRYIDRLRSIDLAGVEPLAHVGDTHTRLDPDVPGPALLNQALTDMAPDHWQGFVRVPKVLGDEGGGG
jgi:aspartyl-tRNA(Asn)/glutamyl-tRNA(Gln) amidotransferase subunit C